jgi:4-hydroxybenzoate polyprenyltransferase
VVHLCGSAGPWTFIVYEFAPGVFQLLFTVVLPLVPISVGIAILRYCLYEIDRIITRTLVYGLLTVVLGVGYAAGSLVFVLVAAADRNPPSWLVTAATLAAAALFQPARRRIQAAVDRRYNAAATTQPRRSRGTAPACATRSTWRRSQPSCGRG